MCHGRFQDDGNVLWCEHASSVSILFQCDEKSKKIFFYFKLPLSKLFVQLVNVATHDIDFDVEIIE